MWVVVADSSEARIFETPSPVGEFTKVESLEHEESRLDNRDFETDRPGRVMQDRGGNDTDSRTSYEPSVTPKEKEKQTFAKKLADKLDKARVAGEFDRVAVIAAPKLLGRIRNSFSSATENCVIEEVSKDLTDADPEDIKENLTQFHK